MTCRPAIRARPRCRRPVVFGAPDVVLLDLPQLREDQPAHRPMVAAHAKPWPGEMAVFRSAATDGFALLTTFGSRARMGVLVSDFYAGPVSRFDLGNALVVDLLFRHAGKRHRPRPCSAGPMRWRSKPAPGNWEIVQAGAAELIAPGRYRLTRLLRGQRGTEGAMGNPAPTGARVVVLDTAAGAAADRRGRSRSAVELAHRPGVASRSATRPLSPPAFTPAGRWAAAVLRRPMSSSRGARRAAPAI